MLAHKVDGQQPTSYSDHLLAAQKLERWAEARDFRLQKTTITGGLNVTQLQTLGNLFPSRKLEGNHTFTAQSIIVESIRAEEDLSVKPEVEEEAESSDEDPETLSGIGGADQQVGYIIQFDNAVELHQKENQNCFRCGSLDHLMRDCPKDHNKITQRVSVNVKEGTTRNGGWARQKQVGAQLASLDEVPKA